MATRENLAAAAAALQQAGILVNQAHELVSPIPKGIPSSALRSAIDRARDVLAAATATAIDELRYLERLEGIHPDPALDDVDQATSFGAGHASGIPQT